MIKLYTATMEYIDTSNGSKVSRFHTQYGTNQKALVGKPGESGYFITENEFNEERQKMDEVMK